MTTWEVTRNVLERREGNIKQLLEELLEEVAFLSEHLLRANWQHEQFEACGKDLSPPKTLVMVMDFAEIYASQYQDEVQSAHWNGEGTRLLPAPQLLL